MTATQAGSRQSGIPVAAFGVVVALSRLPLIGGGYGSDDDSWRNVVAALRMRALGHYAPSRPPGFPVFESLLSLLAPYGWLATNGATALAGTVAALLFLRIATRLRVHAPGALGLGFAFCSGLWITTSQTMDYAFGLAFMLAAYLVLLDRRWLAGGILLALAAGCRATLGVQLLAAVALLLARREPPRAWWRLLGGFATTIVLVFLPVALSPELGDLRAQAAYHVSHAHVTARSLLPVTRGALVFTFGRFGLAAFAIAALVSAVGGLAAGRRRPTPVPFERGPLAYEGLAIVVSVGFFLLIPYEDAYLLPAVPFLLLLAARALPRGWIVALVAVLALEPLVTVNVGRAQLVPGSLFREREQRRADVSETRELAALAPSVPTVYVVGRFRVHRLLLLEPALERRAPAWLPFYGPGVALWRPGRRIGYAQSLTAADRDSLQNAGYAVHIWPAGWSGAF